MNGPLEELIYDAIDQKSPCTTRDLRVFIGERRLVELGGIEALRATLTRLARSRRIQAFRTAIATEYSYPAIRGKSRMAFSNDITPRGIKDRNALLTPAEAAAWLRVQESTISKWIDQGRIDYITIGYCLIRFEVEALQRFVESQREDPDAARLRRQARGHALRMRKEQERQEELAAYLAAQEGRSLRSA